MAWRAQIGPLPCSRRRWRHPGDGQKLEHW